MFAGLGGEEKLSRRAQREKPTDEFHLGDAGDDLVAANSTTFDSDMEDLLDRYSVDVKQLDHLEGEERTEATHHLYRRNALRENRMNAWVSEQCRPLLVEYQTCFAQTRYKIPFITCAMEDNAYNHCLNLAMVRKVFAISIPLFAL